MVIGSGYSAKVVHKKAVTTAFFICCKGSCEDIDEGGAPPKGNDTGCRPG